MPHYYTQRPGEPCFCDGEGQRVSHPCGSYGCTCVPSPSLSETATKDRCEHGANPAKCLQCDGTVTRKVHDDCALCNGKGELYMDTVGAMTPCICRTTVYTPAKVTFAPSPPSDPPAVIEEARNLERAMLKWGGLYAKDADLIRRLADENEFWRQHWKHMTAALTDLQSRLSILQQEKAE